MNECYNPFHYTNDGQTCASCGKPVGNDISQMIVAWKEIESSRIIYEIRLVRDYIKNRIWVGLEEEDVTDDDSTATQI